MARNLIVTNDFTFDARSFDFATVYAEAFAAYDNGQTLNYTNSYFNSGNSSSSTTAYDRSNLNQDGTSTLVHVIERTSGSPGAGTSSNVVFSSIKTFSGAQLLYTLEDELSVRSSHTPLPPTDVDRSLFTAERFYNDSNQVVTGENADYLLGGNSNDVLSAYSNNDYAAGGAGNDFLYGGAGNDQLDGGTDADYLDGGADYDFTSYDGSVSGVVIRLDYGVGANGDAQGDQLFNIEGVIGSNSSDFLIGDSGSNALLGQNGDDWLYGQSGNDELHGGAGSDQILGGAGSDLMYGDAGNDQFWILAGDIQPSVWDYIYDFGESSSSFDYLRFEGVSASDLIIGDNAGNAVITTTSLNYSGGIIVMNFSGVQLLDQMIFA